MMKHIQSRVILSGSRLVRQLCTETVESVAEAAAPKLSGNHYRLYKRLSALGVTGGSVAQTLNEYIMEGKTVRKDELTRSIRELRQYRRFNHALEVMEWMEGRKMNFSYTDHALRIDLIAKSKGIAAAENYFSGLSPAGKNRITYGSLLNCYCRELMIEKALALFEKMDELKFIDITLPFDNLMSMYMKLGQPEKVPPLVDQMKQRNISPRSYTYSIWMQSYASLNDIAEVERIWEEMVKDSEEKCSWETYSNLAAIYVKAGLIEKAELALKKLEEIKPRERQAYHFLISLYACSSNLVEVNRIWDLLKSAFPPTNSSYLVVLQALDKLNAIGRLKERFDDWKSSYSSYDMRLANVAIRAYLKHDMHDEAVSVFDDAIKRCKGPYFKAREAFIIYYLRTHQLDLALNEMGAAVSEAKNRAWRPTEETVSEFFRFLEDEKDVDGAEEFCKVLKSLNLLNSNAYRSLIKTYIAAGKSASDMRQRLEEDDIEISHELGDLLASVCSQ